MALDAGHDFREVSEWLGHADYTTTLRVYARWIPAESKNSMVLPAAQPAPAAEVANVISLASRRRTTG